MRGTAHHCLTLSICLKVIIYQVLLHLVRAGAELAEWRFMSSLMLLHGAHTRLVAWETSLGARSSEVFVKIGSKKPELKICILVLATRFVPHFSTSAIAASVACQNEKRTQCQIRSIVLQHPAATDQCLGYEGSLLKTRSCSGFFPQVSFFSYKNMIFSNSEDF
jgi:KICSTOR complex C12orf66 like